MPKQKTVTTHNDLDQATREQVIGLLNQQLADTFDLFSQTKQAHWNIKGPQFYQLHLLYDTLAEGVEGYVDEIAERATALGGVALGTARMAAANTRLPEYPAGPTESLESVQCLVDRYAALAASTAWPSIRPTKPATPTPPTSLRSSRATWISGSGSSRRTCSSPPGPYAVLVGGSCAPNPPWWVLPGIAPNSFGAGEVHLHSCCPTKRPALASQDGPFTFQPSTYFVSTVTDWIVSLTVRLGRMSWPETIWPKKL